MDGQTLIVAGAILVAIVYAGAVFFKKTKAFTRSNACADDCGCSSKSKSAVH